MEGGGFDAVRDAVERMFSWAPGWLVGLALLAAAAAIALLLHGTVVRVLRRYFDAGNAFMSRLLQRSHGPTRLGLVILALALALQAAPFGAQTRGLIEHTLLLAFIALVGWVASTAVILAADLYTGRLRLDADDSLLARKHRTQVSILKRAAQTLIVVVTVAAALMSFDQVREFGVSLFASAGAAGLILGLAARPVLSNLIAGIQIAITQPIRIEDQVVVEGETGFIEEIGAAFVTVRLWDLRRMVVPLSYFIEKPFQNWTRDSSALIGTVFWHVDYTVPVDRVRTKLEELVKASSLWDGSTVALHVTDATQDRVQLRALMSARNAREAWDLRCEIREKMIAFLRSEFPYALPHQRTEVMGTGDHGGVPAQKGS